MSTQVGEMATTQPDKEQVITQLREETGGLFAFAMWHDVVHVHLQDDDFQRAPIAYLMDGMAHYRPGSHEYICPEHRRLLAHAAAALVRGAATG